MDTKEVLVRLIRMRRELEVIINELSGDPIHREFRNKIEAGERPGGRALRNYDMPPVDPEVIATAWGLDLEPIDGTPPDWFAKYGPEHTD